MAERVTITLKEPIPWHRKPITEIVLRPPNLVEYGRFGDPYSFVRPAGADAQAVYVENDQAVAGYMECCVVEPADKLALQHVRLADAMEIKAAILGFFVEARLANAPPDSPTPSSSTSD
jgi:hypothetical protein